MSTRKIISKYSYRELQSKSGKKGTRGRGDAQDMLFGFSFLPTSRVEPWNCLTTVDSPMYILNMVYLCVVMGRYADIRRIGGDEREGERTSTPVDEELDGSDIDEAKRWPPFSDRIL